MEKFKILIADDEERIRVLLKEIMEENHYEVDTAEDGYQVLKQLKDSEPDLLLLDLKMPGMDGIELVKKLKGNHFNSEIIIITGQGTIRSAIEATRLGVFDYIEKPIEEEKILLSVQNALKNKQLREENLQLKETLYGEYKIVGRSQKIQELLELVEKASQIDTNVLITGNNGTGKDLFARNIHLKSPRNRKPFVIVNCAAIPEHLIESELFGYEKGAFTGAVKTHAGKFEVAAGGTLFLNEIAEIEPAIQAKLLTLFDTRTFHRLGGHQEIKLEARLIAATNKNLTEAISKGQFREDLFYRLNVLHLRIPDLKEHAEDILPLFDFFMQKICSENGLSAKHLDPACIPLLYNYSWPGNARELKNLVAKLAITVNENGIQPTDMEIHLQPESYDTQIPFESENHSLRGARDKFERDYIAQILQTHHGNVRKAADELQVERTHLYKLMKKLGIERESSD